MAKIQGEATVRVARQEMIERRQIWGAIRRRAAIAASVLICAAVIGLSCGWVIGKILKGEL